MSLDGIGAYEHIHRAAMLGKVPELPRAKRMLPFLRLFYSESSCYLWSDAEGFTHNIVQGEGGEQGDPLMPALFGLGMHEALKHAASQLQEGEKLFAYLDDVYLKTTRERAAAAFQTFAAAVENLAGVKTHLGKLEAWSATPGPAPPDLAASAPTAWKADLPPESNGMLVLGVPIGTQAFQQARLAERLQKESALLEQLHCRAILLYCASP